MIFFCCFLFHILLPLKGNERIYNNKPHSRILVFRLEKIRLAFGLPARGV